MQEIKNTIIEYIDVFIKFAEGLSPTELWLVIALVVIFLIYLAYRTLGLGAVLGVVIFAFFAYVLYNHPSFDAYGEKQKNDQQHMQQIQEELNKGIYNEQ